MSSNIDKLKSILEKIHFISNPKQLIPLFEEGKKLALEENLYEYFLNIGRSTMRKLFYGGKIDKAIDTTYVILDEATKRNDTKNIAKSFNNLGVFYRRMGHISESIKFLDKALKINEKEKNYELLTDNYCALGNTYDILGNYTLAIEYFNKAIETADIADHTEKRVSACGNLGRLHFKRDAYDLSIKYYEIALGLSNNVNLKSKSGWLLNGLGANYFAKKMYDTAISYYLKAIDIATKNKVWRTLGYAYNDMGVVYKNIKKYDLAIQYYKKSLEVRKKSDEKILVAETLLGIAMLHSLTGQHTEAVDYLEEVKNLTENNNKWERKITFYEVGYEIYNNKGDVDMASKYLKKAYELQQLFREREIKLSNSPLNNLAQNKHLLKLTNDEDVKPIYCIRAKHNGYRRNIPSNEILWVENINNEKKVKIITDEFSIDSPPIVSTRLTVFLEELEKLGVRLLKTHRSYAVNPSKVQGLVKRKDKGFLTLSYRHQKYKIEISRTFDKDVRTSLPHLFD